VILIMAVGCAPGDPPDPYTADSLPQKTDIEDEAILQALRLWVEEGHHLEVVFVVRHLKAGEGYAWVHVQPQSEDGASRYEDLSALMKKDHGGWIVAEVPCAEVDNPACLDHPTYFPGLKERFPDMPEDIFPR
jgi:hypothetical protein